MEQMIVIGNPGNKRTAGLQAARARLGLPLAQVLPYLDLLQGKASLASLVQSSGGQESPSPMLRLDAPGEHFEVERALIALGAPDAPSTEDGLLPFGHRADPQPYSAETALKLQEQRGKLYHPSQWFRGYGRLLARLDKEARELWAAPSWLNSPHNIIAMFDKRATHHILNEAGVTVPRQLALPGDLPDYEALRIAMASKRMHRIFLKLASGSGACGVIAYQINPVTGAELAVTTLGVEHYLAKPPMYYNDKRLHRYSNSAVIKQLVNWLLRHGAHAEQWIAKASFEDRTFDIRQLVVAGEACHSVARVSRTPITNLHLNSERMKLDEVGLDEASHDEVKQCAQQALAAFHSSSVAGIDVLLSSTSRRPYVLDVNPFGDLLYHVVHRGYDPYEWELRRLAEVDRLRQEGRAVR